MTVGDVPPAHTAVIADDHAIVRQSVRQILTDMGNIAVVDEAENGLAAIAAARAHKPALLVLDAAMPFARGIEAYAEVRRWSPGTRIVLLTGFTSVSLLMDWLEADVDGILLKSCLIEEMKTCFTTVLEGGHYVAEAVSESMKVHSGEAALTNREREVLALIAGGLGNPAIGERLCISPKTVEKHRASLMNKLGVRSVSGLMVHAFREGLLDELKQL